MVIGVLGALMGLLLPAVQQTRAAADRSRCLNNLRQIGLAFHNYEAASGHLPPLPVRKGSEGDPNAMLSWMALILPHIDQSPLWEKATAACRSGEPAYQNPPHIPLTTVVKSYICPSDGRLTSPLTDVYGRAAAYTSYLGVSGGWTDGQLKAGVLSFTPGLRTSSILDGASQTLIAGERPPPDSLQAGRWYTTAWVGPRTFPGPDAVMWISRFMNADDAECRLAGSSYGPGVPNNPCDRYHFWSLHQGGGNWLFADGSCKYLPYTARSVLDALATVAGGEVIDQP